MSSVTTSKYLPSSTIETVQNEEVLLKENHNRWVMFPIEHDSFWVMYKEVENNFWAAEDFILSEDKNLLLNVSDVLMSSLRVVLSYHLMLDNTLNSRPADMTLDLLSEVQVAEARAFYGFQLTDENVHSETVGMMFQHLGFKLDTNAGSEKVTWLLRELNNSKCFFKKNVLVVVSKLLFNSTLNVLRDFLVKDKLIPTYTSALDAMKTDRQIHVRFAYCVFRLLDNKMVEKEVLDLVKEATKLELDFALKTLPLDFMNLNPVYLKAYVESVANNVLLVCGYNTLYDPDFDVEWLLHPTVDLNVQKQVTKTTTKKQVENLDDIKFDEDF